MLTRDDVRRLLMERQLFSAVAEELGDDTPILLDSMSLIWLLHGLQERHGVEVSLVDADISKLTSVGRIHEWVLVQLGRTEAGEER